LIDVVIVLSWAGSTTPAVLAAVAGGIQAIRSHKSIIALGIVINKGIATNARVAVGDSTAIAMVAAGMAGIAILPRGVLAHTVDTPPTCRNRVGRTVLVQAVICVQP